MLVDAMKTQGFEPHVARGLVIASRPCVYFEYANRAGQLDHATLHAGAPVEIGEKWVLTKWMRARPFIAAG